MYHMLTYYISSTAFRLVPYPLEKGHLFHPYPACTENADRELLPSKFCIECAILSITVRVELNLSRSEIL